MGKPTERLLVFIFGVIFVVVMLIIAIGFPEPKPFQYTVFRIVLALAAAGIASLIPGFLNVEVGSAVKAGGAIAVFVIVYFFSPAKLVAENPYDKKSKAIDQLGSKSRDVKIGAIYTLEQIARDSRADHWLIMETLTAYVRNNSPWQKDKIRGAAQEKCKEIAGDVQNMECYCNRFKQIEASTSTAASAPVASDIQAALDVIARRESRYEDKSQTLDLSNSNLQGAKLPKAHLENANFRGSNLKGVDLREAFLNNADLSETILDENTTLGSAKLQGANISQAFGKGNFYKAELEGARFNSSCLEGAEFAEANLSKVSFDDGAFLKNASMWDANATSATFELANLEGAMLDGMIIKSADFRSAVNLTREQVIKAIWDSTSILPESSRPKPGNEKPTVEYPSTSEVPQIAPLRNLLIAVKLSDASLLENIFSTRVSLEFQKEGLGNADLLSIYTTELRKDLGDYSLQDITYDYEGDENAGEAIPIFKGKKLEGMRVVREANGQWKLDEK